MNIYNLHLTLIVCFWEMVLVYCWLPKYVLKVKTDVLFEAVSINYEVNWV